MSYLRFLLLAFVLAGCFDAEMDIDVANEQITVTSVVGRQLYDMQDNPECEGESTLDTTAFTCIVSSPFTLEGAVKGDWGAELPTNEGAERDDPMTIVKTGRKTYRFEFDNSQVGDQENNPADDPDMAGMMPLVDAAIAGHSIVVRLKGVRILETNGETSPDMTSVTFTTPLAHYLHPDRELVPAVFYADFRAD